MIFAAAGKQFEDVRIKREDWPTLKTKMPFGQIPVLEIDGKPLAQSYTIGRYLARQFGLAGKDAYEEGVCDSIVDQFNDFFGETLPYKRVAWGFLQGDKEKLKQEIYVPAVKKHMPLFVNFLKNNKSGYLVGDGLTWADIVIAYGMGDLDEADSELLDDFPELRTHYKKIHSLPKLKEYLEKRPKCPF
ncbi:hypothetical protein WR25_14443 [Diploscapter pachys]|uniref:glutathione transferase n=1 Tax=Diploscapter pachys TaxID=2018661 RepID=A0A2A2JGA1_9BILA|nr:hypothetical protein WR25_14443 [Diploscapter pachys]